jgi:hypothetical protein
MTKDNHSDLNTSKHAELVRLFEQSTLALEESDTAIAIILNRLDLDFAPTHGGDGRVQ